jgi:hypothetical protein
MKHNLLSMSQMCDQGHKVTFDSQKCEIRKEGSRKLIATAARTSSNIYVLSEIGNEKCCLRKEDESWIWHRRMVHIHFDNLVFKSIGYKEKEIKNAMRKSLER